MANRSLKSIVTFLKKEGILKTASKTFKAIWHEYIFANTIIYQLKTNKLDFTKNSLSPEIDIQRINQSSSNAASFIDEYAKNFGKYRGEKAVRKLVHSRFKQDAELWVFSVNGQIANTQWAIRGKYIDPFYYPLSEEDVVFFDAFTFDEFRRKGINTQGLFHLIHQYGNEGVRNVILMIKVWNKPSLGSAQKAPMKQIGIARKFNIFGKSLVFWFDM